MALYKANPTTNNCNTPLIEQSLQCNRLLMKELSFVKADVIVEADWECKMVFQPIPASIGQDDQPSRLASILRSVVSLPASLPTF